MRRSLLLCIVGIKLSGVLLLATGCTSGASGEVPVEGKEDFAVADWSQPLTVCKGLDEGLVKELLFPPPPDTELDIEVADYTAYDHVDGALSAVSCTFSYGSDARRIAVEIVEHETADTVAEVMTTMKNSECERVDEAMFVDCAKDESSSLESMRPFGSFHIAVGAWWWEESGMPKGDYQALMIRMHEAVDTLLTEMGLDSDKDTQGDSNVESAGSAPTVQVEPEEACALAYAEVNEAFSYDGFHTVSTEDQSTWITAFGVETLDAACSYVHEDPEEEWSNDIQSVLVSYRPYREGENFYPDRAGGFAAACETQREQYSDPIGGAAICEGGLVADIVMVEGTMFAFQDDFAWQMDLLGTIDSSSVSAFQRLGQQLREREPGDRRQE